MAGSTEVKAWQLNVSNAAVQAIALDVDSKLISTAKSVGNLSVTILNSTEISSNMAAANSSLR